MPKKKVHRVAKNLGLSSAALLKLLKEMGIKVKSHMSVLSDEEIKKVRHKISEDKKRVKKEFTRRYTKPKVKEKKKKIDQEEIREKVKSTLAKLEKKETKKHYKREIKVKVEPVSAEKIVEVSDFMTVAELAQALKFPTGDVIKKCLDMGLMVSLNQRLDLDTITVLCDEFGTMLKSCQSKNRSHQMLRSKVLRDPRSLRSWGMSTTAKRHFWTPLQNYERLRKSTER